MPVFDRRGFRTACHEAAHQTGGRVIEFRFSDCVAPNFHQGVIAYQDHLIAAVCSRDLPLAAVAEPRITDGADSGPLTFLDAPGLLAVLADRYQVLTTAELNGPLDASLWPNLDARDIKYWKPHTLGEALFNYWD
ncbi:hypothetical protein SAMN05192558_103381 [Actinokineospora alba]|uniref:Uncharacterized protein n=1 Tax=Actinokineospora alba TaxID=504798 RepID=A0A1H0K8Y9_9PSEU|nr:hypothetical protein [Actinokineospora alba]TDP68003.1 hypothetical protein C8E96_3561 [Actinokineospora alba]SDH90540.1 hypothetical protein SAMN05421871_102668 [Actinokineospora alba]SDO52190.1 hypothetical protein SAMN05192558_103381 [Actinokineospora alba]